MKNQIFKSAITCCLMALVTTHPAESANIWDAGGANTNINTADNWDDNTVPLFDGTQTLTFGTAGSNATINTAVNVQGLVFNRNAAFGLNNGAGSLTIGSGGITATTAFTHVINPVTTISTNLTVNSTVTNSVVRFVGTVTDGAGTFGITKNGVGQLQFQSLSANTYDGVTNINAGTLEVNGTSSLGSTVGNTVLQGGATLIFANGIASVTTNEELVIQGSTGASLSYTGSGTAANLFTQAGNLSLDGTGGHTISANFVNTLFTGTIARTGSNSGVLNLVVRNDNNFNRTMTFDNAIDNNGGAVSISGRSQTGETHSSTVVFNATGNDIGAVTLNSDVNKRVTLRIGADNALATNQNLTITRGIVDLAGNDQTINALSGVAGSGTTGPTALITNSAASTTSVLTVGNGGGGATMGGVIENGAGIVALTKVGAGSQTLSGVNTYTGNTTVSAGTLVLADNAELRIDVNGVGSNTQVLGTGTLTLNGDFRFDLTGASTAYGTTWTIVNVGTLNETYGGTFQVFSTLGAFTNNAGVWTRNENGMDYVFTQSTGLLTVVPEPSILGLLAGGLTGLLVLRRRRHVC